MIVTVASAKGGTGKTTVAVSLALAVASFVRNEDASTRNSGVVLLDCDVEEPNAHLFLQPSIHAQREVGIPTPVVDETRCTFCGRCSEVCAYHAIAVLREQVVVFPELCHGCGSCALNCPETAIREHSRAIGLIEEGQARAISFAHGILNVGEAMGVPIIREIKRRYRDRAGDLFVILDAPPGTSCPVVESLRGADYALMVTEPTPFGLHDLRLAVQVARGELGLTVGVVVNRDGVGDDGVDDYCRAEGIPTLMRIPLDRRIAQVCSDARPLVVALPEYLPGFINLYRQILAARLEGASR